MDYYFMSVEFIGHCCWFYTLIALAWQ